MDSKYIVVFNSSLNNQTVTTEGHQADAQTWAVAEAEYVAAGLADGTLIKMDRPAKEDGTAQALMIAFSEADTRNAQAAPPKSEVAEEKTDAGNAAKVAPKQSTK